MLYSRIVLVANGAFFALYGLYLVWWPEFVAETLWIANPGAIALTEFRAMYGGLELALGGLMIWWGLRAPFIWSGLTLLTVSAAGLLAARLIGMLVDGGGGAYLVSAAVYEFLALVLGGVGLWLEGRRSAIEDAPETS